jgi:hypothetical protein
MKITKQMIKELIKEALDEAGPTPFPSPVDAEGRKDYYCERNSCWYVFSIDGGAKSTVEQRVLALLKKHSDILPKSIHVQQGQGGERPRNRKEAAREAYYKLMQKVKKSR